MHVHDIEAILRTPPTWTIENGMVSFWTLDSFGGGSVWVGQWMGESPWEMHRDSDEMLQMLDGTVEITLLADAGTQKHQLKQGTIFVVPKGIWHRQSSRNRVLQMGVTPGRTEHSMADDPRAPN